MKLTLNTASLPPSLRQIVEEAYGKKENAKRLPTLLQGIKDAVISAASLFNITIDDEPPVASATAKINDDLIAFLMSGVVVRDRKDKAQE